MSGAIGAPQPSPPLSPTKKGEVSPRKTPSSPSPGPSPRRNIFKNGPKKEHQKQVTQDIVALKKGKRPLVADSGEDEEEQENGHRNKRVRNDESLWVKGYIGNVADRTNSEGGILLGVISPKLRTGPRTVRNTHGQDRWSNRFGR